MIETAVSRHQELASERFLKESEDRRVEREVRRHGLLANPVVYVLTGQCYSPSVYSIQGHGNSSTFLLRGAGERSQDVVHYDEHYTSYAHYHKIRFKEM